MPAARVVQREALAGPREALAGPREALAGPREVLVGPWEALVVPRGELVVPRGELVVPREVLAEPREVLVVQPAARVAQQEVLAEPREVLAVSPGTRGPPGIVAQQGVRRGMAVVREARQGMAAVAAEPKPAFAAQTVQRALEGWAGRRGSGEQALLGSRWALLQTALGQKQGEFSCRRRTWKEWVEEFESANFGPYFQ